MTRPYTFRRIGQRPCTVSAAYRQMGDADFYDVEISYDMDGVGSTQVRLRRYTTGEAIAALDLQLMDAQGHGVLTQEEKDAIVDEARQALEDDGDYAPVEPHVCQPLPLGTRVEYDGSVPTAHRLYRVEARHAPDEDANPSAYIDGVAYDLWPEGMVRKMGNRHYALLNVRRTSLTVLPEISAAKIAPQG